MEGSNLFGFGVLVGIFISSLVGIVRAKSIFEIKFNGMNLIISFLVAAFLSFINVI